MGLHPLDTIDRVRVGLRVEQTLYQQLLGFYRITHAALGDGLHKLPE